MYIHPVWDANSRLDLESRRPVAVRPQPHVATKCSGARIASPARFSHVTCPSTSMYGIQTLAFFGWGSVPALEVKNSEAPHTNIESPRVTKRPPRVTTARTLHINYQRVLAWLPLSILRPNFSRYVGTPVGGVVHVLACLSIRMNICPCSRASSRATCV